jgi:uncharacterized membrane protein
MGLLQRVKDSFVAGLILVAPLAITLYILRLLVNWSLQFINPLVAGTRLANYTGNVEVLAQVVAVLIIVGALTVIGAAAQWSVGRHLFGNLGKTVNFVPLVSTIYGAIKQTATSLVDRDTEYESVVLVEYPREDIYSIGLVTSEGREPIDDVVGEQAYSVFLPNSPNPTAGRLVMLPASQIHETDMSVRQGMRMIVTTGIGDKEAELEAHGVPMDPDGPTGADD